MNALQPAMTAGGPLDWPDAIWVGEIDVAELERHGDAAIALAESAGYARARLLVRRGLRVLGFVDAPVADGEIDAASLRSEVIALDAGSDADDEPEPIATRSFTVVICTRDRPDQLRGALASVLRIEHPDLDVLVVDNASATTATRDLVATEFADPRVRLVEEPRPGLSQARNTGLLAARGEFVAFTDDDVIVDPQWLRALEAAATAPDVWCVSGLVPSGELRTPVQAFFDGRVSWSRNLRGRSYRLAEPPADLPMFPFSVGEYGTGANFAVHRERAIELGGFDTAFGVGTPTGGGEDLDFFTRVLFAGGALVMTPDALVWHRHRADLPALRVQARGYGTGLGAWLTRVATDPRMRSAALRRAPRAAVRLFAKGGGGLPSTVEATPAELALRREISRVGWIELAHVFRGPALYARQRRRGAGLIPAAERGAPHDSAQNHDEPPSGTPSDPGATPTSGSSLVGRAVRGAVANLARGGGHRGSPVAVAGVAGLLASAHLGSPAVQTLLIVIAVGIGPGMLVNALVPLRPATAAVVVPGIGLAIAMLLATLDSRLALGAGQAMLITGSATLVLAGCVIAVAPPPPRVRQARAPRPLRIPGLRRLRDWIEHHRRLGFRRRPSGAG